MNMWNGTIVSWTLAILFSTTHLQAQSSDWSVPIRLDADSFYKDYPAMAIGRDGRIFVVWETRNQPEDHLKAQIFFTTYDGQVWSQAEAITDTGRMDWTPDIAVDTLGNPHVVWGEYQTGEVYHQCFEGTQWSTPENISNMSGGSYYPRIAIDRLNRIHVVWHDNAGGGDKVLYRSFDGTTWSPTFTISDTLLNSLFPRLCTDSQGNLHVTFGSATYPELHQEIFYRNCQGGTWAPITRITMDSVQSYSPDIAVLSNHRPVIVWGQVLLPWPLRRVYWSRSDMGGEWQSPIPIADTSESVYPSIGVDSQDNVHVAWELRNRVNKPTRIMYSSHVKGQWSSPSDITGQVGNSGRVALKVDQQDDCHVLWAGTPYGIYYSRRTSTVNEVRNESDSPATLSLEQNYPNPFNGRTIIRYYVGKRGLVTLKVYDLLGREVKTLVNTERAGGSYSVTFDASEFSSGVYFFQLRRTEQVMTIRALHVR